MSLKEIKEAVSIVFRTPRYVLLSTSIAVLIFLFFLFLGNAPLFVQVIKLGRVSLLPGIFSSVYNTIVLSTGYLQISLMALVSILTGMNISMVIFKYKQTTVGGNHKELSGMMASAFAAFGAGCPACATSLLSLMGVVGGLSILPFGGVEITSLSTVLLIISLYFVSKGINQKTCKIRL